jgi:hypothetical protein
MSKLGHRSLSRNSLGVAIQQPRLSGLAKGRRNVSSRIGADIRPGPPSRLHPPEGMAGEFARSQSNLTPSA